MAFRVSGSKWQAMSGRVCRCLVLLAALTAVSPSSCFSHDPFSEEMGGWLITFPVSYDFNSQEFSPGASAGLNFLFVNASGFIRKWGPEFEGWNGKSVEREYGFSGGLNLGRLAYVNPTISNAGFRILVRSDLVLFTSDENARIIGPAFPDYSHGKVGPFRKCLILSPSIESDLKKTVISVSIGLVI